jgi:hypothetical protein
MRAIGNDPKYPIFRHPPYSSFPHLRNVVISIDLPPFVDGVFDIAKWPGLLLLLRDVASTLKTLSL